MTEGKSLPLSKPQFPHPVKDVVQARGENECDYVSVSVHSTGRELSGCEDLSRVEGQSRTGVRPARCPGHEF